MFLFKRPQKAASAHVWAATAHGRRTSGTLSTVYNRLQAFQVVSIYAFETRVEMRYSNIQEPLYDLLLLLLLLSMSGSMLAVVNTSLFCTPQHSRIDLFLCHAVVDSFFKWSHQRANVM